MNPATGRIEIALNKSKLVIMPFTRALPVFLIIVVGLFSNFLQARQNLWFGTVKTNNRSMQARFEADSLLQNITYAPYGITPVNFKHVKKAGDQLTFLWPRGQIDCQCVLIKQNEITYKGTCKCGDDSNIEIVMRNFIEEDAKLQGQFLAAGPTDIKILDRALQLLNDGSNWNRFDNRVCDNSTYPFKWSLFCALHQASIDIDQEYRHIRPAMKATRQAIDEATGGKKYAHLLRDFNNETQRFEIIAGVLTRAKEIITEMMKKQ
jgi:hypothetical protein